MDLCALQDKYSKLIQIVVRIFNDNESMFQLKRKSHQLPTISNSYCLVDKNRYAKI